MNELVSIIVPVYNAAPYLEACLKGILEQKYRHIQVVLIDDGSTDNSRDICEEYEKKDSRIRLVSIPNGGVSNARNIGLDMAAGGYVTFVDSDDIVSSDYVGTMVRCAVSNNADIVCCNIIQWNPKSNVTIPFPGTHSSQAVTLMNSDAAIENMLRNRLISAGPYAKLLRKKIIGQERFSALVIAEDLEFNFRIISRVKEVVYCDSDIYTYRQTSTGAMRKPFALSRMDAIQATVMILGSAEKNKKNYVKAARYRLIRAALHCAGSIIDSDKKRVYKEQYELCRSIIRQQALAVLVDSRADVKMRMITALATLNLPLAWTMMTGWHKLDIRIKQKNSTDGV